MYHSVTTVTSKDGAQHNNWRSVQLQIYNIKKGIVILTGRLLFEFQMSGHSQEPSQCDGQINASLTCLVRECFKTH